jgi:branched-chain amino acid transport system ATP-binding protein
MAGTPALEIRNLEAWYGESHVLHGVDMVVQPGEVVTLLGRNGAGRTSTMRAIMGLTGARKGSVKINGTETIGMPTHRIAHLGVGYCPEERGIFSSLSCEENLMLPPVLKTGTAGMPVDEIYAMFPNLAERRGSQGTRLSGGEQQMLAVARALAREVKLLLLDEPYEGLAPVIVREIETIVHGIKERGITTIIVEQNAVAALRLADRAVILDTGELVFAGAAKDLLESEELRNEYLAI